MSQAGQATNPVSVERWDPPQGVVISTLGAVSGELLAQLQELIQLLDPSLSHPDPDGVERAVRAPGVTVFAAIEPASCRLVGVATLVTAPTLARVRAWAEDLVVHPDYRGRGVGASLMNACAQAAAEAGARELDGTVHRTRVSAIWRG